MREKILSVFVDEAGDFGELNKAYPYYLVAMVFHDQSNDISANIKALEEHITNWGYPNHAIHTAPLIRRESIYKDELREQRKSLFNALYHFTRMLDIKYICPVINKKECKEKNKLEYTNRLTKEIVRQIKANWDEYSCAVKPHVRSGGNHQSGIRKPLCASLLAQIFI